MTQNAFYHNEPPNTPDHFRLTQLLVQNGGLTNRPALQALPLCDLMELAHLIAAQKPTRFTPDLAWAWLLMIIEPLEWEVKSETWYTGDHYVAYWGGQPITCQPRTAEGYTAICHTMREWFDTTYPKRLTTLTIPHIPFLEASHAN